MGNLFNKPVIKMAMVGLSNSGKTCILYQMKLGEMILTINTIGFNVETITHQNLHFSIYDPGGSDKSYRYPLWRQYFPGTRSLIFVIDSSDRESMEQVHLEFWRVFSYDEVDFKEVLIYANKQDVPNAMTAQEITEKLELYIRRLPRNINWYVQECSAKTGTGLFDGLSWIVRQISNKQTT